MFHAYIADETQARTELARLKTIALWLHGRVDEMEAMGEKTWASVYKDRLSTIRPQIKEIVHYLNN